jgi:hypothetical protein
MAGVSCALEEITREDEQGGVYPTIFFVDGNQAAEAMDSTANRVPRIDDLPCGLHPPALPLGLHAHRQDAGQRVQQQLRLPDGKLPVRASAAAPGAMRRGRAL